MPGKIRDEGQAALFDDPVKDRDFAAFHAANPMLWVKFQQVAIEAIQAGMTHWSADAVMHVVRFQTAVREKGSTFKINNDNIAGYARLFLLHYPQYAGFFELRRSKADREVKLPGRNAA